MAAHVDDAVKAEGRSLQRAVFRGKAVGRRSIGKGNVVPLFEIRPVADANHGVFRILRSDVFVLQGCKQAA